MRSGFVQGSLYIPAPHKLIFGEGQGTDITIEKTGANAIAYGDSTKLDQHLIRGRLKLDERPTGGTTEDYAFQIRSESAKTSGTHWGIDSETHLKASGTTAVRGVQGVAVVDATFTVTNGGLCGVYGQARADGTFNAPTAMMAGVYGLIEDSAAVTASHVASVWADSHMAHAVTGNHELFYGSNNGATVLDQVFYLYGDAGALFRVSNGADNDTLAYITGPGTAADGTPIKVKIIHNGTAYFINAYPTDH